MDEGPQRWTAVLLVLSGLGLGLVALLLPSEAGNLGGPPGPKGPAASSAPPARGATKPDLHLAAELGVIATAGASEDAHVLDAAPAREAKIFAATRRFLAPYLRYEVGQPVSPHELRSSASAALVDQLLSDPPHFPPRLDRRPRPATVTQITVSENRPESPAARPRATVVVRLDRVGRPEAAAFTLAKTPRGRWLITGVSG